MFNLRILNQKQSSIIYESPHRILKTLNQLYEISPNRELVVLKELTKLHETEYRGPIKEIIKSISNSRIKGEFVIIINGQKKEK